MNAPVTKDQLTFSLGKLSYIGAAYEDAHTPLVKPEVPRKGLFSSILAWIADWRQRQSVMREMQLMTDHELADIGLVRSDIPRVFDPSFVEDYRRGRDYAAF